MSSKDQAATLRRLMRQRAQTEAATVSAEPGDTVAEPEPLPPARVMVVASGKGGVGKSTLTATLATLLARSGARVLAVDGDFGLANLDILFGVHSVGATIEEVLGGRATLHDALVGIEPNLWLLPASSGLLQAVTPAPARLRGLFDSCPWAMDLILIDAGAGVQDNVLKLHGPLYDSLVVLTPEPTSLTDAYGLVKLLNRHSGVTRVEIVVNQVTHAPQAQATYKKFKDVVDRFLDVELDLVGYCEHDENFTRAVMNRKILLDLNPEAPALPALELLSRRIRSRLPLVGDRDDSGVASPEREAAMPGNTARFWRALLGEVKA
ncbi:MAG: P-loop NTPase [Oligoflexia bacterium]|nr:P-loop NTPase [Oligoflexia bacterium]